MRQVVDPTILSRDKTANKPQIRNRLLRGPEPSSITEQRDRWEQEANVHGKGRGVVYMYVYVYACVCMYMYCTQSAGPGPVCKLVASLY